MAKLLIVFLCLTALVLMRKANAAPVEDLAQEAADDDLSTADSIGVGYYAPSYYSPFYGGGYGGHRYGGYGGYGYGYGGYRGYSRYYRRPIYPVWG